METAILIAEAMAVYLLVLWTHSLRQRFGLAFFYALLGGITAVMSWVTDAGVVVRVAGVTFMVGSTVFYTSLLLGVFVVYVFDGPRATRNAIFTVAGVSALTPLIAWVLHVQMASAGQPFSAPIPVPSLRINAASVLATIADLLFLAIAWEFLGKAGPTLPAAARALVTLVGVMCLDVLLFATGAFVGTSAYVSIMKGTLLSRLIVAIFAWPFLYAYMGWQNRRVGPAIENRPILAILHEVAEVRAELDSAQREIERRKQAEARSEALIRELETTLSRVKKLEGLLPVCSGCHRIRVGEAKDGVPETWVSLEEYVRGATSVEFSHGLCEECIVRLYPDFPLPSNKR